MKAGKGRRSYDQRCALAVALDLVGERWTLLVVRELMLRTCRYRDLLDALPGIGTNLLADRLSFLTDAGIIRPLDPNRRTAGYTLTELGERLREPVLSLSRFGLAALTENPQLAGSMVRPTWGALAIESMLDERRATELDETYEFAVDGEIFHVKVQDGRARVAAGAAADAVLRIVSDAATFFDIGAGRIDPLEAVLAGTVTADGSPAAVTRCLRLLGLSGVPDHGETPAIRGVSAPRSSG